MFGGAIDPHPDFEISRPTGDFLFPNRTARLVRDDPDEMAQEGARLLEVIMARGWVLDVPVGACVPLTGYRPALARAPRAYKSAGEGLQFARRPRSTASTAVSALSDRIASRSRAWLT